ncbi:MAG: heme biosynthesis HemY N-terminal domain-containing protein [Bordetella sp.]|jgi:heme biosynthesis-associated TPR repeat protein
MKWFLAKLIGLAILIGLVLALQSKGGMVSVWWDNVRIDLSLATAIFALLALLFVVVVWIRTWDWLRAFPDRIRSFRQRSREAKRLSALADMVLDYFEGRFSRVTSSAKRFERDFRALSAPTDSLMRLAAALASRAAHQINDYSLRDYWLDRLNTDGQKVDHPQLQALTQAMFALDDRDPEKAKAILSKELTSERKQIHTMRIMLKLAEATLNLPEAFRLARLLENRHALPSNQALEMKSFLLKKSLMRELSAPAASEVGAAQDLLSSSERQEPVLVAPLAQAWLRAGVHREARLLLESVLKRGLQDALLELYGSCLDNPAEQLSRLQGWLAQSSPHATGYSGLLAQGLLALACGDWQLAKERLEQASTRKKTAKAQMALAEVYSVLNDLPASRSALRTARELVH